MDRFEKHNAQVLGVSPDDLETHQRFTREHGISFPLVADPTGKVQQAYDRGRVTYVIDRSGIVRHRQQGIPDNDRLLAVLADLQSR